MEDTLTIVGKEPKFAAIRISITNKNIYTYFSMNRSTTFWRLAASLMVVLLSVNCTFADAKTITLPRTSVKNLANIALFASIRNARVGDLVNIEVTTNGFTDVEEFTIPIGWNPALLSLQNVGNLSTEVTNFTQTNFNTTNSASGFLLVNWADVPSTISDGMPFFTLLFRVLAYSPTPAAVSFNNLLNGDPLPIYTSGGVLATVNRNHGKVNIIKPNNCPSRAAGLTCHTAPLLNATEFPYSAKLPDANPSAALIGSSCILTIDNMNWLAFVAGTPNLTFKVLASNCNGGDGVQFLVFKTANCDTFQNIVCTRQIMDGVETSVDLTGLTIGSTYYIMIDGYYNGICNYTISVGSGQIYNATQAIQPPTITGLAQICGSRTNLTYSIPTVPNAETYLWRANAATPTTPLSGAAQKSITVDWGSVSDSVCVRIVAKCDTTAWFCKSVKVGSPNSRTIDTTKCTATPYFFKGQNRFAAGTYVDTLTNASGCDSIVTLILKNYPAITRDSTLYKCAQDGVTWGGVVRRVAGDYPFTFQTAAGCDSIVTLRLFNYPTSTKNIDTTICAGTSIVVGGQTKSAQGNSTITVSRGSSRGCDSIISLKLTVIDFTLPTPTKSNEITCELPQSTLTAGVVNKPTAATVAYEWRNSSNVVIGTTPSVSVNQAGVFTVTATVSLNGKNCPKTSTVTVTKTGNQPAKPSVAGAVQSCGALNETYILTPSANAISYNWTVSNGTFTNQTNQITTTWNANATASKVCVNAQNACGLSDTACISVEIGQIPPPLSITGSTTVCPNATITYRVSSLPNTTLLWSVTGGTAQNAFTSDSLWVRWAATNGRVTVTPSARCGSGTSTNLDVQISNSVPDSLPIQGILTPCSNDTTIYTVADAATTTDYAWQVPTGASILRGQGTRTITVVWGTFSGNGDVFLTTKNACQLARGVKISVIVKNATSVAPTINGSRTVCPSTQISFSTPRDPNIRTYTWTVPTDAAILRGQGSDSIRVDWRTSASGQVCLDVENTCGNRQRTCINVEVRADLDSLVISSVASICKDSTVRLCVPDDGSALRFVWQVPGTAAIISGQNTSCLTVRFSSTGGTVRLVPIGGCSDGKVSRRDVVVNLPPTIVGTISGKNTVCNNSIQTYSVALQTDVRRYIWNLPTGVRFIGDSTGNSITVDVTSAATNGFLIARAENDCGIGNGATIRLTVVPRPLVNAGVDTAVCGKTALLSGSSNGSVKTWSVVTKPAGATANFTTFDRSQTIVTTSKSGVYTFRFEEINGGECSMADSVNVTFKDAPTVTLLDQNCNQEATDYRVQLSISGSAAPFSIGGSALGTLQNATFLSNTISSGTPYFFIVTDNAGCKSDTLKGVKQCPCYTSAGTLRADSLVVCYGSTGKATALGDAKLDANDISEYVLHTGTATRVGNIFLRNKTGIFAFDSAFLLYNRVYFVTFIVGDQQQASGNVDTSKRCVSQSRGIPIIFKNKFTAGIVGDTTVCRFAPVSLGFKSSQTGLLDLTYQAGNNGPLAYALNRQNNDPLSINPSVSAIYKLTEVKDKSGCLAQITDSARINVRPLPISNAGLDRSVCTTDVQLEANENFAYKGKWTSLTAGIQLSNPADPRAVVSRLQNGRNIFIWTVNDSACLDYSVRDTVQIFLPLLPKAINLSLISTVGKPVNGNVSESAPLGTYSVTRLTNPPTGRFDLFSNGSFTYIPEPTFQGIITFKYLICSDLCTKLCDTGNVRILIQPKQDTVKTTVVEVPNAITPNDDGKNDALIIDGLQQYSENELTIFNRWGDVLYKLKPYNNAWRGTNQNGDPLPEGTYYYVLRLNTSDGKILRGDITILR